MSAIAGIYHLNKVPVTTEEINAMMGSLKQFPADDVRLFKKGEIFLGCHAQWITPESLGEVLPYYDEERKLAITADAIIDNREDLFLSLNIRKDLRDTIPDSQLILLAYEKWEEESPKYLIGDFAFMIWDERKQTLFGARDVSGYRTLYYFQNTSRFSFCTTIDPLLSLPFVQKRLNEQWLAEYLVLTGMIDTLDAYMTPYENIFQIPPGHNIKVKKDSLKLTKYVSLYHEDRLKLKSDEEYVEAFQEVFQKAVNARLRTHRNIGSQLSGGLDSGAVVGFAGKVLRDQNKELHTISYHPTADFIDFTNKRLMPDERPFIKKTVQHVPGVIDHYYDFKGKDSYSEIDDMLNLMEMPYKFFENSFWLKGMFEKAEEHDIGILLNGDRGNWTVSWGMAEDYYAILLKQMKWIRLFHELNQYSRRVGGSRFRRLPLIARIGFPVMNQVFPQGKTFKMPSLINPRFADATGIFNKFQQRGIGKDGWVPMHNIQIERKNLFQKMFPWNSGNTLTSKLSLRHSLWKRDPTNDIRVAQFCMSLPESQYVQNGVDRALIRRATVNILPEEVRLNQRIRGVQGADWVHRMKPVWNSYMDELREMSTDTMISEFLDTKMIKQTIGRLEDGPLTERAFDPTYKTLMRCLIVYRFIKNFN
jgi:asparagine synthase (glutamine-hydrolysing)